MKFNFIKCTWCKTTARPSNLNFNASLFGTYKVPLIKKVMTLKDTVVSSDNENTKFLLL